MPVRAIGQFAAITTATLRGGVSGRRIAGLGLIGALYPLVVLGLAAASTPGRSLVDDSETIFTGLFLTIFTIIVTLVLGASQFRTEIEEDTLVYLTSRRVARALIVAGKYAGSVLAAALILLPSALVGTALSVALANPSPSGTGDLFLAEATMSLGAILAYSAIFLLLGLLTAQSLPVGLLYGFLWEELVALLPGPIQHATVAYYLRALGGSFLTSGPLSSPTTLAPAYLVIGFAGLVAVCLLMASGLLEWVERRPVPTPQ